MTQQNSLFRKNDFDYLSLALDSIKELFAFETNGRTKYRPEDIAITTLLMCTFNTSAETVQMIEGLPSADRVLERLGEGKALELGEKINLLLKKRLNSINFPKKGKITVACDITEKPFYGNKEQSHAMGGKPKDGTCYFVKYLTFSLVVEGHRFPTGFYPLTKERLQWVPEIVAEEIKWLQERDLCDRIVLDRGFNDFDTYNKIDEQGNAFLMPLKKNSKLNNVFKDREPLINKRERKKGFVLKGYYPEEWNDGFRVLAIRIKTRDKKNGEKMKWVFFITNMKIDPWTALFIYKRRWGIETAYSQVHALEAFTKSRKHAVRVFLTGLAFLLFSAWVYLNWQLACRSHQQRNTRGKKSPTVNRKRFKITVTLPRFRLSLLVALLISMTDKNGNQTPMIKQRKS
ncbi:MAG: transposase [Candidatus Hodarchaeales archaeon]